MIEIRHRSVVDTHSIQLAYNNFFRKRKIVMRDSFYLWLLELVEAQARQLLVDVACGNGRLVQLAAERGIHAIGLDLAIEGISEAAQASKTAHWIVGDGQCLPFPDRCADIVMSIGSLEHYANPVEGVAQLARIVKPEGVVCILLPNAFGLLGNIRHVVRFGEVFDDEQPIQRYATRRTWSIMLNNGGLQIERTVPFAEFNRPRTYNDFFWTYMRPQKFIKAGIGRIVPLNLANHFVFLCRPYSGAPRYYPLLPY